MVKKVMKKKVAAKKPRPEANDIKKLRAQVEGLRAMTDAIHAVLDEHGGDEAVKRIREVLYGPAPVEKPDE